MSDQYDELEAGIQANLAKVERLLSTVGTSETALPRDEAMEILQGARAGLVKALETIAAARHSDALAADAMAKLHGAGMLLDHKPGEPN